MWSQDEMTADSIRDRIIELLLAERRDFEARQGALAVHPITGKPIGKDELNHPYPAGTTDRQLNSFSRRTGLALPPSLRAWLKITSGATGFYGVRPSQPTRNIQTVWERFPEWQSQAWFPVADDGFGNFYVQLRCEAVCFVEVIHSTTTVAYVAASDMLHFALFMLEDRLGLHQELAKSNGIDVALPKSRLQRGESCARINPWPFSKAYMLLRDPKLKSVRGLPFAWR
jgi:hypothetical protein